MCGWERGKGVYEYNVFAQSWAERGEKLVLSTVHMVRVYSSLCTYGKSGLFTYGKVGLCKYSKIDWLVYVW